jgi:hypothetical protein
MMGGHFTRACRNELKLCDKFEFLETLRVSNLCLRDIFIKDHDRPKVNGSQNLQKREIAAMFDLNACEYVERLEGGDNFLQNAAHGKIHLEV